MSYRPNVAFILRREDGHVLICERSDFRGSWQFPQGGIKHGETPLQALTREVAEELNLPPDAYRVIDSRGPYRYDFPPGCKKHHYTGQEQTYFLAEPTTPIDSIDFTRTEGEFVAARWILPSEFSLAWLPPMKHPTYSQVLRDFFNTLPQTPPPATP